MQLLEELSMFTMLALQVTVHYLVHLHQKEKNALFNSLTRICLMGLTIFKNSSAKIVGSVLYGGAIDTCKLTHGLDS